MENEQSKCGSTALFVSFIFLIAYSAIEGNVLIGIAVFFIMLIIIGFFVGLGSG